MDEFLNLLFVAVENEVTTTCFSHTAMLDDLRLAHYRVARVAGVLEERLETMSEPDFVITNSDRLRTSRTVNLQVLLDDAQSVKLRAKVCRTDFRSVFAFPYGGCVLTVVSRQSHGSVKVTPAVRVPDLITVEHWTYRPGRSLPSTIPARI